MKQKYIELLHWTRYYAWPKGIKWKKEKKKRIRKLPLMKLTVCLQLFDLYSQTIIQIDV